MSAAREFTGPWLSRENMEAVPGVRRAFDLNRDPYIARQIRELETPGGHREDQAGGGHMPRTQGKRSRKTPAPALELPPPANGQRPSGGWLSVQRAAAMAACLPSPRRDPRTTTYDRNRAEPER